MNKFISLYLPLIIGAVLALGTTGCSDNDEPIAAEAPTVEFVTPENGYSVEVGERLIPEVTITGNPTSYSWKVDGKEVTRDQNYVFSRSTAGVSDLEITVGNEGGIATATTKVLTVVPGTDIAATIDINEDADYPRLTDIPVKAIVASQHNVDYLWTVTHADTTWISTDKTLNFNTDRTGAHKLTLKVTNILGSATDEATINVKHAPLDVKIITEGDSAEVECGKYFTLRSKVSGDKAESYSWTIDGKAASDSASLDFLQIEPGTYAVVLTVTNGDGEEYSDNLDVTVFADGLSFGMLYAGTEMEFGVGETDSLYAVCEWADATYSWSIDGTEIATTKNAYFDKSDNLGDKHTVTLVISHGDDAYTFERKINIGETYAQGAFILFEGNMTSEPGAISFLSNSGTAYSRLCKTNNDGFGLGNVAQGMYLHNRKVYVVTQNGSQPGRGYGGNVTVLDGRTMKVVDDFENAIFKEGIVYPKYIAVANDRYAIVRGQRASGANTGILDMQERKFTPLTLPEDLTVNDPGAFIGVGNKLYQAAKTAIYEVDYENAKLGKKVIDLGFNIDEIRRSADGYIWVISTLSRPVKTVAKLSPDMTLIEKKVTQPISQQTDGASMQFPRVNVGSDYIFFSTSSTGYLEPVWKYDFETNTAVAMQQASFYNAIGYNEVKKTLYIGNAPVNEYDISGSRRIEINSFNCPGANFPAGIWFTTEFDQW